MHTAQKFEVAVLFRARTAQPFGVLFAVFQLMFLLNIKGVRYVSNRRQVVASSLRHFPMHPIAIQRLQGAEGNDRILYGAL
jgi:hypothetical protein